MAMVGRKIGNGPGVNRKASRHRVSGIPKVGLPDLWFSSGVGLPRPGVWPFDGGASSAVVVAGLRRVYLPPPSRWVLAGSRLLSGLWPIPSVGELFEAPVPAVLDEVSPGSIVRERTRYGIVAPPS